VLGLVGVNLKQNSMTRVTVGNIISVHVTLAQICAHSIIKFPEALLFYLISSCLLCSPLCFKGLNIGKMFV